jgi:hypothetical protein
MTYYILPKYKINYNLNLILDVNELQPFISYSLNYYNNYINNQKKELLSCSNINTKQIEKIINPYEFMSNKVCGLNISVSKLEVESNLFFDLFEITKLDNMHNFLNTNKSLNILCFSENLLSCVSLFKLIRGHNINNDFFVYEKINLLNIYDKYIKNEHKNCFNLMIFEFNSYDYEYNNDYIKEVLVILFIILKYQNKNGSSIIKISNILCKPIIDIIYILTSVFDKVELYKPVTSNIIKYDSYLICNNLNNIDNNLTNIISTYISNILTNNLNIQSLIDNIIPSIFKNKIEEFNVIIGQQYLESNNQIISILKSKNYIDKLDIIKRNHIQRCIQWCEKNNIPFNKINDKVNIFLSDGNNNIESYNIIKNVIEDIIQHLLNN